MGTLILGREGGTANGANGTLIFAGIASLRIRSKGRWSRPKISA